MIELHKFDKKPLEAHFEPLRAYKEMIYNTIYNKIITILEGVDKIKEIKDCPLEENEKFSKFPAVVVYPEGNTNIFDTSGSDFREYRFKMFVIVNTQGTTMENVFRNVLSNTNDEVLQAFAEGWNFSRIDGKRVWARIESGTWGTNNEQGKIAFSEFNIIIKLSVDNTI
jgi:hypothetical protein